MLRHRTSRSGRRRCWPEFHEFGPQDYSAASIISNRRMYKRPCAGQTHRNDGSSVEPAYLSDAPSSKHYECSCVHVMPIDSQPRRHRISRDNDHPPGRWRRRLPTAPGTDPALTPSVPLLPARSPKRLHSASCAKWSVQTAFEADPISFDRPVERFSPLPVC